MSGLAWCPSRPRSLERERATDGGSVGTEYRGHCVIVHTQVHEEDALRIKRHICV